MLAESKLVSHGRRVGLTPWPPSSVQDIQHVHSRWWGLGLWPGVVVGRVTIPCQVLRGPCCTPQVWRVCIGSTRKCSRILGLRGDVRGASVVVHGGVRPWAIVRVGDRSREVCSGTQATVGGGCWRRDCATSTSAEASAPLIVWRLSERSGWCATSRRVGRAGRAFADREGASRRVEC